MISGKIIPRVDLYFKKGIRLRGNFRSKFAHKVLYSPNSLRFYSQDTSDDLVTINWKLKDGSTRPIVESVGIDLLTMAHKHGIDLEGACEGSLACSTCHVIIKDPEMYNKLPEISDEENDMLDLAFGLTETSRLGCQIIAKKELDGMVVHIPSATRNMMLTDTFNKT